jgi:hypothetical protein
MDNTSENNEAEYKKDWRKSQLLAKRLLDSTPAKLLAKKVIGSKPAEKVVKKIKDKQIWAAFGGLTNFLSFVPTLIFLNIYFLASVVVGNEFSTYIIKLNKWHIAVLALANLIFFITILVSIFFITLIICYVSLGQTCPLSLWDIIKGLWDLI